MGTKSDRHDTRLQSPATEKASPDDNGKVLRLNDYGIAADFFEKQDDWLATGLRSTSKQPENSSDLRTSSLPQPTSRESSGMALPAASAPRQESHNVVRPTPVRSASKPDKFSLARPPSQAGDKPKNTTAARAVPAATVPEIFTRDPNSTATADRTNSPSLRAPSSAVSLGPQQQSSAERTSPVALPRPKSFTLDDAPSPAPTGRAELRSGPVPAKSAGPAETPSVSGTSVTEPTPARPDIADSIGTNPPALPASAITGPSPGDAEGEPKLPSLRTRLPPLWVNKLEGVPPITKSPAGSEPAALPARSMPPEPEESAHPNPAETAVALEGEVGRWNPVFVARGEAEPNPPGSGRSPPVIDAAGLLQEFSADVHPFRAHVPEVRSSRAGILVALGGLAAALTVSAVTVVSVIGTSSVPKTFPASDSVEDSAALRPQSSAQGRTTVASPSAKGAMPAASNPPTVEAPVAVVAPAPAAPAPAPAPAPAAATPATAASSAAPLTTEAAKVPEASRVASRRLDRDEIELLLKRADEFLATGDITAARLLLRRAAEARDVRAARALAATYDASTLRRLGVIGSFADEAMARSWRAKAEEFSSAEAQASGAPAAPALRP